MTLLKFSKDNNAQQQALGGQSINSNRIIINSWHLQDLSFILASAIGTSPVHVKEKDLGISANLRHRDQSCTAANHLSLSVSLHQFLGSHNVRECMIGYLMQT